MTHTIAIPAYNAADTLGRLLARVCGDLPPSVTEVIVCDNGSTDGTADVVRRWSRRAPAVRLVTEVTPGKPAAWDRLVCEATTPYVIFLDADVLPVPGALARMVETTRPGRHVAYTGRRQYTGAAWVAALADPVIELCLAGSFYAIHRERVRERMAAQGYERMPGVFAEDLALQAMLDTHEIARLDECVVEVPLESMDAFLVLLARRRLVRHELSTAVPRLGRRLDELHPQAIRPWPQLRAVLEGPFPITRKVRWLGGGLAKSAALLAYRTRIDALSRALIARYDREGGSSVLRAMNETAVPEAALAGAPT